MARDLTSEIMDYLEDAEARHLGSVLADARRIEEDVVAARQRAEKALRDYLRAERGVS